MRIPLFLGLILYAQTAYADVTIPNPAFGYLYLNTYGIVPGSMAESFQEPSLFVERSLSGNDWAVTQNGYEQVDFLAHAKLDVRDGWVKTYAHVHSGGIVTNGIEPVPSVGSYATVMGGWTDQISLVSNGSPNFYQGSTLDMNVTFDVSGYYEGTAYPVTVNPLLESVVVGYTYTTLDVGTSVDVGAIRVGREGPLSDQYGVHNRIVAPIQLHYRGGENPTYSANVEWRLSTVAVVVSGDLVADFMHTLKPTAITFADGTTPESNGINIAFSSGMLSPNLTAVPEPSSLAIGSMSLMLYGWYRRRLQRIQ